MGRLFSPAAQELLREKRQTGRVIKDQTITDYMIFCFTFRAIRDKLA